MGNWLDNIQQLTSFKPYTSQLPVDAMVKVGSELQRRYGEGVEKIQSAIDRVAGLDIVRDVDRQYLQSKLNALGGNLKNVAGGDFSDYQLVNSLAGAASQIGKDQNIINAVSSTKYYRKGIEDMQAAIKEGKSSPSNEWLFKSSAAKWLQSKDISESFSDGYQPYTDVKKHAIEVIKALTKNSNITEEAFTVDAKGKLVIADAIVRKQLAGISPEQIQQALMVGLSPADMKQLEIDGRYNYSNLDEEGFKKSLAKDHNSQKETYLEKRKTLEGLKATAKTADVISAIDDKIKEVDKTIERIDREYSSLSEASNVESAKAMLHTRNFMNGFGAAFSFTETVQEYKNSPFADMMKWRENLSWDKYKFAKQMELDWANKDLAERKFKWEQDKEKGIDWGGFPDYVEAKDLPEVLPSMVEKSIEDRNNKLISEEAAFLKKMEQDKTWLSQAEEKWRNSPTSVSPEVDKYFTKRMKAQRDIESDVSMLKDVYDKADAAIQPIHDKIINDRPVTVNVNGESMTFTAKEIADFSHEIDRYRKSSVSGYGEGGFGKGYEYDFDLAKKELNSRKQYLFDLFWRGDKGMVRNPLEKEIVDRGSQYNKVLSEAYKERDKVVGEELKNRVTSPQGVAYTIDASKPQDSEYLRGMLQRVYNIADQIGGQPNSPRLEKKVLEKIMLDPKIATIKIVEGTEYQKPIYEVMVSGKEGNSTFRLTEEQKRGVLGNRFEASPEIQYIRPYQDQMRKITGSDVSTTAKDGRRTSYSNAYLEGRLDFPSVKTFGVSGNLEYDSENGMYLLKLNLKDPVNDKWIEDVTYPSYYLKPEEVAAVMSRLSDSDIYRMIYNKSTNPTQEELKAIEELVKKR